MIVQCKDQHNNKSDSCEDIFEFKKVYYESNLFKKILLMYSLQSLQNHKFGFNDDGFTQSKI